MEQIANALATQIGLNLRMNITVNFAIGFGFRPLLGYTVIDLLLLSMDPGVHNLQMGSRNGFEKFWKIARYDHIGSISIMSLTLILRKD